MESTNNESINDFIKTIDPEGLNEYNLRILDFLIKDYQETQRLNLDLEIRIEKNMRTQKKITLGFFLGFIILMSFMAYNSPNPFDPGKIFFIILIALTMAFIWRLPIGP